ncbi:penicillin acylase family protein, partial [uncultured Jatrophihabitans sp.]|uniref:penicillin acylase family protein n=1 Tax=uncultured Jatrophihabitans sp. TaxID=1610747 RepID=UPI0035CA5771
MTVRRAAAVSISGLLVAVAGAVPSAHAAAPVEPSHAYRSGDYADGRAMSILPPGENGLVTATDAAKFEAPAPLGGVHPANSQDQLGKYSDLLYGYPSVTDSTLNKYYLDESFGVRPSDITRTETPGTGVHIYRDTHDIPHVYGTSDQTMAFGAGYAQAEDRLFLMDVLRHYGEGTLAGFLGASCAFEQMDHDQLLLSPYTAAQATAQVDNLPNEYGQQGALAKSLIENYVKGVNAYIASATLHPAAQLPADYAAALPGNPVPQKWTVADVVAIAGLIGGIFGRGGGSEFNNAKLLQYLRTHFNDNTKAAAAFRDFRTANDPLAPTTADKPFPYETPGKIDASTTALPDSGAAVTGGPTDTTTGCATSSSNPTAMNIIDALTNLPKHMSNALVVNASHSADGHPVAVFGPQVSYFAPQILSQLDLHSPDYAAEGASFPGTGIVELGRGRDYAWSATSAGSDLIDQRLEKICNPNGGAPAAEGTSYEYKGKCVPMVNESFDEATVPTVGSMGGAPAVIHHEIHLTRHGIVLGWTMSGGQPVAEVLQRSTYNHDVDSVVGFLGWGEPSQTHDVQSWMKSAERIEFTFNWFYVDNRDTGYYVSGLDPVRPSDVDPDLPTWGTGNAEWQGYLPASQHVHEINPPTGYFVSWNNKPAPQFAAADDQYGYGQVYRSIMLTRQLDAQLSAHGGKVTRAQVVQAMETAASQDLDGVSVMPLLLKYLDEDASGLDQNDKDMLDQLKSWVADGAHRHKASPGDAEYQHAAAIAISDELMPNLIEALYDGVLKDGGMGSAGSNGGATSVAYAALPMQFVNTPNSGGAHLGSAYDGGYESYLVATLQQLLGQRPADGFGSAITNQECTGGPSTCRAALEAALTKTYDALQTANGSSTVSSWTQSTDSKAANQKMPVFDAIQFRALGIVTQPAIDWQNRPTFQQVIEFYRHRPRGTDAAATVSSGSKAAAAPNALPTG